MRTRLHDNQSAARPKKYAGGLAEGFGRGVWPRGLAVGLAVGFGRGFGRVAEPPGARGPGDRSSLRRGSTGRFDHPSPRADGPVKYQRCRSGKKYAIGAAALRHSQPLQPSEHQ